MEARTEGGSGGHQDPKGVAVLDLDDLEPCVLGDHRGPQSSPAKHHESTRLHENPVRLTA